MLMLMKCKSNYASLTPMVLRFSIQGSSRGLVACPASLLPFFYLLTLAPRDYVTYCQARGLDVGIWPPVSTRQDMGRMWGVWPRIPTSNHMVCALRGGPAHKTKPCRARFWTAPSARHLEDILKIPRDLLGHLRSHDSRNLLLLTDYLLDLTDL